MIDEGTIERAAKALLGAAPRASTVILFGSYGAGRAGPESDLDFLVVEPEIKDRIGEMARLSRLLGKMLIPADVVVVSRELFERFRDTPNTLAHEASRGGRVYESVA
ncbi:MAG: nucleotidyltransferase domain-containing protein [Planctomycetota bacterium]